jgi:hypothetical protein
MTKYRLEAFSDGVIAIIITIMVLELRIRPLRNGVVDGCARVLPAPSSQSSAREERTQAAIGRDWEGKLSPVLHLAAIFVPLYSPRIAQMNFESPHCFGWCQTGASKSALLRHMLPSVNAV